MYGASLCPVASACFSVRSYHLKAPHTSACRSCQASTPPVTSHIASGRVRLHRCTPRGLHAPRLRTARRPTHATNTPHTPLFNLTHFHVAWEQCAKSVALASQGRLTGAQLPGAAAVAGGARGAAAGELGPQHGAEQRVAAPSVAEGRTAALRTWKVQGRCGARRGRPGRAPPWPAARTTPRRRRVAPLAKEPRRRAHGTGLRSRSACRAQHWCGGGVRKAECTRPRCAHAATQPRLN